jgi:hypothetical protein
MGNQPALKWKSFLNFSLYNRFPGGQWVRRGIRFVIHARQAGVLFSALYLPLVTADARLSSTLSSEKLPTFWLGGNSLNEARYFPMYS